MAEHSSLLAASASESPPAARSRSNAADRVIACDSCYKKKIKCEADSHQCNYCLHRNIACTFNRLVRSSKKRKARDQMAVRRWWDEPPAIQPHSSSSSSSTKVSMVNLGLIYLNGKRDTADEGRAWIESRTGEIVNMDRLITMKLPWTRVESVRDFLAVPKLPARPIVERNIAAYCSSYQSLVFPVISQSLFTETLDLAYGSHGPGVDSAKACVYAFLSVVAIFGLEKDLGDALDCETYALASQSFTVQIINEMTVDGLRALVMLTQHHYFLGDLQRAAVSVSMASRLVFKLGAHEGAGPTVYDRSLPECHLRDLFWLCYSFDQDICLRTGQPPSTAGVFCSLDLPTNYAQLQDTNLQHPEQTLTVTDTTLPLYPWDLRLSRLKAEIYEALYSTTACQRSNSELVARIRSLDQALEHWRISLAREIRPTLHFSVGMSVDGKLNTQAVMLRLAYYHCVTIIHQATERHHDEPGICSSLSLAIRASRSSLAFLQTALPVVKGECFWVIIFYAITSILTLFRNILKNPLDPDMADLVAVLQGVPNLIREIPIRTLTVGPMIHLRFLNNFATELARLATCAIAKAEREVATSSVASHELPGP